MAVRQQVTGRVLTVTIDNPGTKNAFDQATMAELRDLFENIAYLEPLPPKPADDLDVGPQGTFRPHVIVLRSSGDIFCAGAHLGEMKASGEADLEQNLAFVDVVESADQIDDRALASAGGADEGYRLTFAHFY